MKPSWAVFVPMYMHECFSERICMHSASASEGLSQAICASVFERVFMSVKFRMYARVTCKYVGILHRC